MKLFLDTNIILDLIDLDRKRVKETKDFFIYHIQNGDEFVTSCDIFTTIYYVASKKIEHKKLIAEFEKLFAFIAILPIDAYMVKTALEIGKKTQNRDLEDILQYICAKVHNCDVIVTNDKNFFSPDLQILRVI